MPMVNPFQGEGFDLATLTAAINKAPFKPGRIAELGLFEEQGVNTPAIIIDERDGVLGLVQTTPRGAPAGAQANATRTQRSFVASRLARHRRLMADEVLGVRAFGSQTQAEVITVRRDEILASMRADIEATIEWHRIGAIKGTILDADATSVIYDMFAEFGLTQQTVSMALPTAATEVLGKCQDILEAMESALGSAQWSGARVLCGSAFWKAFITHPKVKEAYLQSTLAANLRNDPRDAVTFGGITFERYRGSVGGQAFIEADDAYAIPEGVPGLFLTRFAPADYIETVNTLGLPIYAKAVPDAMGHGIDMEVQSNPLSICTRPRAVIRLTRV